MLTPLHQAAKARAIVRLPDGRTGRLLFVPKPGKRKKARVILPSGAVINIDPSQVVPDVAPTTKGKETA